MGADLTDQAAVEAVLLRPLTSGEAGYVTATATGLIAQASSQLRVKLRAIDDRIAAYVADPDAPTGIDPDAVKGMLAEVIKRVLVNPRGLWSATSTTGPFSRSETYPGARGGSGAANNDGLTITDDDMAKILPPSVIDGFVPASTIRTRSRHLLGTTGPRW